MLTFVKNSNEMRNTLLILFLFVASTAFSQNDTKKEGTITINQDERISELVDRHIEINKASEGKISGWRVQIYTSSGTNSRNEAQNARKLFLSKYPEVGAYLIYQPPFFKIRVGDFRTKEEAYSFYKQLLVDFPVSYLVNDQINLPKLKGDENEEMEPESLEDVVH